MAFLDLHLKPLVTKVPHILEDTRDFLNWITEIKDLPEDAGILLLGTSIGTKFAPTYANLFFWIRYLDDIFCIWTEGLERLQEFYQCLKKKAHYKQTYLLSRQILTGSYTLNLVIVMFTKSPSRMDRLLE